MKGDFSLGHTVVVGAGENPTGVHKLLHYEHSLPEALAAAGFNQVNISALREAGNRVTNARKHFGNLCGGDKETRSRGGNHRKDYGRTHCRAKAGHVKRRRHQQSV